MKGILGKKVGMTQVFTTDGKLIPVTVVYCEPNVITQIKTSEKDGYNSIQLGAFNKKIKSSNKPEMGHLKKSNTEPKRFLKEIKGLEGNFEVGAVISVDTFDEGEIVDVVGTSKGKGFAGVIKRYNQSRGPMSHGSDYHRRVGSMGPMRPMRVLKGKKLPGHMGNEQVTIQNLEIISVDLENNYILISGNIPGPKGSYVLVRSAIKELAKKDAKELVSYEIIETPEVEETVVEEVNDTEVTSETEIETPDAEVTETEVQEEKVSETTEESASETEEVE